MSGITRNPDSPIRPYHELFKQLFSNRLRINSLFFDYVSLFLCRYCYVDKLNITQWYLCLSLHRAILIRNPVVILVCKEKVAGDLLDSILIECLLLIFTIFNVYQRIQTDSLYVIRNDKQMFPCYLNVNFLPKKSFKLCCCSVQVKLNYWNWNGKNVTKDH